MRIAIRLTVILIFVITITVVVLKYSRNVKPVKFCEAEELMSNLNKNMTSFYIHLASNVKDPLDKNTISNFTTKLSTVLRLDRSWAVGLAEISYSKSFYNINKIQEISLYDDNGSYYWLPDSIIKAGYYDNATELVNLVNKKLARLFSDVINTSLLPAKIEYPRYRYDEFSRRIEAIPTELNDGTSVFPYVDVELQDVFGFPKQERVEYYTGRKRRDPVILNLPDELLKTGLNTSHAPKAIRTVDITAGVNELFVYCNIVKHSLVGDTTAQLLRIVPIPKTGFGEVIVKTYDTPHYFPLIADEIESIEIDLKDENGQRVNFSDGRVIVVLHFKQNELI